MNRQRHLYPVALMARVLGASRSGFYAWITRAPSSRSVSDEKMKSLIRIAPKAARGTYGPRRILTELQATGTSLGRDRIARLRREVGLRCTQKRQFKATTNSAHSLPVVANLLNQEFAVSELGTVYGTDITYVSTDGRWLYLAGVKDLATRDLIGYTMGYRMTKELTHAALNRAARYRKPGPGCIHHSDRGNQYCAITYQRAVVALGMRPSMSRKGNCYDNAPVESFWGVLKEELIHHRRFRARIQAKPAIQEYIEVF